MNAKSPALLFAEELVAHAEAERPRRYLELVRENTTEDALIFELSKVIWPLVRTSTPAHRTATGVADEVAEAAWSMVRALRKVTRCPSVSMGPVESRKQCVLRREHAGNVHVYEPEEDVR